MINILKKIKLKLTGYQDIKKLVENGLKIGEDVSIEHGCLIDEHHCWHIEIGDRVTLAPNVHILAHDASCKRVLGYARVARVVIEDDVFIGAGSIIMPGVRIGKGSIIGAGSVVTKDVVEGVVAAGNPARKITTTSEYYDKLKKQMKDETLVFQEEYSVGGGVTSSMKRDMNKRIGRKNGFLR